MTTLKGKDAPPVNTSAKYRRTQLTPSPLLDFRAFMDFLDEHQIPSDHAYKIWRNVIQNGVTDIRQIKELPKKAYALIEENFAITTSKVVQRSDSKDGSTTKLLIQLQDGHKIETVIMRYGVTCLTNFPDEIQKKTEDGEVQFKSTKRATVCVSSQVGCQMGCTFCATGTMKLIAQLCCGEILEQLYHANQIEKIRNVVFMGMGEPLDNYEEVLAAIQGMTDVRRFRLRAPHISISTVGVVPRMKQLVQDAPDVSLALSLHAPNQELRSEIVPSSRSWKLEAIMEAMDFFIQSQNEKRASDKIKSVMIEYVLIDGINDSDEVAEELGRLLEDRCVMLNVIPYNPTEVPYDYKSPSKEKTDNFKAIVRKYGVKTILRQELGQDISSACGQLVVQNKKKGGCATDIEDAVPSPARPSSPSPAPSSSSSSSSPSKNEEKENQVDEQKQPEEQAKQPQPQQSRQNWGNVVVASASICVLGAVVTSVLSAYL